MTQYRRALELEPDNVLAHNNLGVALAGRGRIDEALGHSKSPAVKPDYALAQFHLGARWQRGRIAEAIDRYRKALVLAEQQHKRRWRRS